MGMAKQLKSFRDHNGKRGTIDSMVYNWMLDIGGSDPNLATAQEQKVARARKVLQIWSCGAAGTKLVLEGERGSVTAKNYVILN
jgi:hypothetical protein